MKNLLNTELYKTLHSKIFLGFLIALSALALIMIPSYVSDGRRTGYEMFLTTMGNLKSFFELFFAVFAGIHVSGALESRSMQNYIMAGNSRIKVLLAKFISYSLAVAVIFLFPLMLFSLISFGFFETGMIEGGILKGIFLRALVFMLNLISLESICFTVSVFIQNLGIAIAANMGVAMVADGLCQWLLENAQLEKILHLTPSGQSVFLLVESNTENFITALFTAFTGTMLTFAIAYIRFHKAELK